MAKPKGSRTPTKPVPHPPSRKLVQSHVSISLYDRIRKHAQAEEISVSAYVRRTLNNYVPGG